MGAVNVAVLFVTNGSNASDAAVAETRSVPASVLRTVRTNDADPPGVRLPSWHTSSPPTLVQTPCAVLCDRSTVPGENELVTTTFIAGAGPLFRTTPVNVNGELA